MQKSNNQSCAGIDEAGRGPLAGPLYAACVILAKNHKLIGIDDSKRLSEKKRLFLYKKIKENSCFYITKCSAKYIDTHGLSKACKEVFKRAYKGLTKKYPEIQLQLLKIDGRDNFKFNIKTEYIIKGDQKIENIAAASILAKVARDQYMKKMHKKYPEYEFIRHMGYGTKIHKAALTKYGACEIHRKSYKPVANVIK